LLEVTQCVRGVAGGTGRLRQRTIDATEPLADGWIVCALLARCFQRLRGKQPVVGIPEGLRSGQILIGQCQVEFCRGAHLQRRQQTAYRASIGIRVGSTGRASLGPDGLAQGGQVDDAALSLKSL